MQRVYQPGDPRRSRYEERQHADELGRAARVEIPYGSHDAAGILVQPPPEEFWYARLTDVDTSLGANPAYSWEWMAQTDDNNLIVDPRGVVGTFSYYPAHHLRNSPDVPTVASHGAGAAIVRMWRGEGGLFMVFDWQSAGGGGGGGAAASALVARAYTEQLPAYTAPAANTRQASANGAFPALDTVALVVGDDFLLNRNGSDPFWLPGGPFWLPGGGAIVGGGHPDNGVWRLTVAGDGSTPWEIQRVAELDQDADLARGLKIFVSEGLRHADTIWHLVTDEDTWSINATPLLWAKTAHRIAALAPPFQVEDKVLGLIPKHGPVKASTNDNVSVPTPIRSDGRFAAWSVNTWGTVPTYQNPSASTAITIEAGNHFGIPSEQRVQQGDSQSFIELYNVAPTSYLDRINRIPEFNGELLYVINRSTIDLPIVPATTGGPIYPTTVPEFEKMVDWREFANADIPPWNVFGPEIAPVIGNATVKAGSWVMFKGQLYQDKTDPDPANWLVKWWWVAMLSPGLGITLQGQGFHDTLIAGTGVGFSGPTISTLLHYGGTLLTSISVSGALTASVNAGVLELFATASGMPSGDDCDMLYNVGGGDNWEPATFEEFGDDCLDGTTLDTDDAKFLYAPHSDATKFWTWQDVYDHRWPNAFPGAFIYKDGNDLWTHTPHGSFGTDPGPFPVWDGDDFKPSETADPDENAVSFWSTGASNWQWVAPTPGTNRIFHYNDTSGALEWIPYP